MAVCNCRFCQERRVRPHRMRGPSYSGRAGMRARQAAKFIEQIPPKAFAMQHWWCKDGMVFNDWRNTYKKEYCGTVGCAAGHMAHKRMFGLTPAVYKQDPDKVYGEFARLFGWTLKAARWVLSADSYPWHDGSTTPADVAARVRLVAGRVHGAQAR